jgi:hypothetical protein
VNVMMRRQMYLAPLILAAAVSLSPVTASAASITPGDSVDALATHYTFTQEFGSGVPGGVYDFVFNNTSATSSAVTIAFATIKQLGSVAYFTGGITTEFLGGDSHFTAQGILDAFTVSANIPAGSSRTLRLTFGDVVALQSATVGIDLTVVSSEDPASPVPEPASLLLLGTALGSLGLARRFSGPTRPAPRSRH